MLYVSLDRVDDLQAAAHRIVLFGTLLANALEDQWKGDGDTITEGFAELTTDMIKDATAIKALIASGCQTPRYTPATPNP